MRWLITALRQIWYMLPRFKKRPSSDWSDLPIEIVQDAVDHWVVRRKR